MRSLLFVPGDSPRKQEKGLEVGADALILDLEDSVALPEKGKAREVAAGFLARMRAVAGRPKLYVRVNALDTGLTEDDLAAVMPHAPDGIMLPKAEGGPSVAQLGARLAVHEAEHGLPDGATRILPIATETARAVFALQSLPEASRRLSGVTWGAEDLSADLGAETNRGEDGAWTGPFQLARNLTLMAAAAAEVDAIDTINALFRDLDGLARECRAARRDGFTGKMAIHPAQVAVINDAFTPTDAALAQARKVVAAFAQAPGMGVVGIDGEMFDRPHLRRAERLLARQA
ncbi:MULTISPECIES: CoA ester lyase [Methylobacterium]|jgi:citrate lyase subunit beta/citryl-CoA lyase|uniref:HpcH/HpaI aldolase/citrate lyase family protein n=1 Tax=Methylobacterium TaxID=407 RepID=UPI0008E7C3A6|nr:MULTISPECIES: CoA ester lyase [Methylobacterium]MBZ6414218.1 CoA ester lyase [Methylobacterium sp.]MBK3399595.1 CoA ester lyase [Methylobacterium ajmalii]MBK3408197.1 CoA ester lyase [Methylobacterium ajmalii]MBK3420487.1 CoA ester lyase [Methylobacterium ajmalii]SFE45916.1 citrate lyase subunit beta / citryl-CoA lyase [Methylobacterium sp. yr596]